MSKNSIATGIHGAARVNLLRLHRLVEFEAAFSAYIAGKVPAAAVAHRRRLMLKIGLPRLK